MYVPKAFAVQDPRELAAFIRANPFGILVSHTEPLGLFATHVPFLLDEEGGWLMTHLARANPHWQALQDADVLVVFPGPHAYISPTWYGEGDTVPTWNYVAVHVYGRGRIIEDREGIQAILERMVDQHEAAMPNPWRLDFDSAFIQRLLDGVVGLRVDVRSIEGKWKLSQNHSLERQENVIDALRRVNGENAQAIAALMEANVRRARERAGQDHEG